MLLYTRRSLGLWLLVLVAFVLTVSTHAPGAHAQPSATRRVTIFLTNPNIDSPGNPFSLVPATRRVSAAAPARGALNALLAGPNRRERAAGLLGVEGEGLAIGALGITAGTGRVNFVSRGPKRWNGTLSAPRFREAVTRTLRQFPNVRRVQVLVNGDPNFDSQRG
jgi:hypothetical protein